MLPKRGTARCLNKAPAAAPRARAAMRRVQILDSLLSERLESLQSSSTFETGLLLAQNGSQADTVLHLIPTPSSDEDGSVPGSVDASWMMTHADAVSHMLPGGIAVLGAYLFSPCAKFPALEVKLRPVLAAALKRLNGVDEAQAVLLLLPTDARKASARVLAANSPSMKPLELNTISTPPQVSLRAGPRQSELPFCPLEDELWSRSPRPARHPLSLHVAPCTPARGAWSSHDASLPVPPSCTASRQPGPSPLNFGCNLQTAAARRSSRSSGGRWRQRSLCWRPPKPRLAACATQQAPPSRSSRCAGRSSRIRYAPLLNLDTHSTHG